MIPVMRPWLGEEEVVAAPLGALPWRVLSLPGPIVVSATVGSTSAYGPRGACESLGSGRGVRQLTAAYHVHLREATAACC